MNKKELEKRKIAYFTMEVGIDPKMPTYSGGLGVLAGDTLKSCADSGAPLIAVTLLNEKGYFTQRLDAEGAQAEVPGDWPKEASGTSGMKACLNGVPNLSVLDGWWIEGCIENVTGWAIGTSTPLCFDKLSIRPERTK